jgi:site-specific recombinase XerC
MEEESMETDLAMSTGALALMLRNGLRAAEVVGLCVGDLGEDQGFRVATIHGKGGKLRKAKLAGATWETLQA